MAVTCRMFTFTGLMTAPVAAGCKRLSTDSVGMLKYPYSAKEAIVANTSAAQSSSTDLSPDGVQILYIQVQQGKAVHIEINPPNRSTAATTESPVLTGDQTFVFGQNWTVSLLEHTIS